MAAETAVRPMPKTYFELVKAFPLRRILDAGHLEEAHGVIEGLLRKDLDEGGGAYLDALTDLVEVYEDEHAPIPDASEADVLRELMRSRDLTQEQLGKKVRIAQSTISAVLNGSRSLTRKQVVALARFFGVSPAVFLPV